jgi:hypothetical protein
VADSQKRTGRRYGTCPHCLDGLAKGYLDGRRCPVCEGTGLLDRYHLPPTVRGLRWLWRIALEMLLSIGDTK